MGKKCNVVQLVSKQVVTGRLRDSQMIDVPGAYTLLAKPKVTANNTSWLKRPQSVASAFLERCVSITAVN